MIPRFWNQSHRPLSSIVTVAILVLAMPVLVAGAGKLARNLMRDGRAVKKAFEEVTPDARRSLVKITQKGKVRALGVVISPVGHVLTKASELGDRTVCEMPNGEKLVAEVLHIEDDLDLVILKVKADGLRFLRWRKAKLTLGQWVIAPGSGPTPLAVGVVGSTPRKVRLRSGILGVRIADGDQGPEIAHVYKKSAAERAGFKAGDLFTHFEGKVTTTREDLTERIKEHAPGKWVKCGLKRGEEQLTLRVRLRGARPTPTGNEDRREFSDRSSGFKLAFEHDAMLTAEECGGVLLNLQGQPIGLNIARASRTGCYAIPAHVVADFIQEHIADAIPPLFK